MSAPTMTGETIEIDSVLLGALEVQPQTFIHFPTGLPGFSSLREFTLVETQRDDFVWLQSVEEAGVTLLLADPFRTNPGFEVDIPTADLRAIGLTESHDALLVLVVVQLHDGAPYTANYQSPVVIDQVRRRGRQFVLPESKFGMSYPIAVTN